MAVLLLVLCLGAAMLFLFPPSSGRLPSMQGPKAVSEKLTVQADGSGLGAIILSKDSDNPVLLACANGLLQGRAGGRNRILSGAGVRITAEKAHAVSLKGIQSFPPAIIFTSASIALLRLLPL